MKNNYDVIVIGAGSGGIGAALSAARAGLSVLLVEKNDQIGGNASLAGVNAWEPGVGGTGIPFEIYKRMKKIPNAVGIYQQNRHISWRLPGEPEYPVGGENIIDPDLRYMDSLLRHGVLRRAVTNEEKIIFRRRNLHGVVFEPQDYNRVVEEMFAETGKITLRKNSSFRKVITEDDRIISIELENGEQFTADYYVDGTANVVLAAACGCELMVGQESQDQFGEPDAPEVPQDHLNGTTLIYRVTKVETAEIESLPEDIAETCWWQDSFPVAAVNTYPNGDLNVNMLPTMEGLETYSMDYLSAYNECKRRVLAHWHHVQTIFPEYQYYRLQWISPVLGIREGPRIIGKYVLTEHDLIAGLSGQEHEDVITIADHPMDTHGRSTKRAGISEMKEPYGVPYRCLLPKEMSNLLVACRGASFSSLAASSCRLSRTMMQLGQAAGTAAALAIELNVPLDQVPAQTLQGELRKQHVQLEWPYPEALKQYLTEE